MSTDIKQHPDLAKLTRDRDGWRIDHDGYHPSAVHACGGIVEPVVWGEHHRLHPDAVVAISPLYFAFGDSDDADLIRNFGQVFRSAEAAADWVELGCLVPSDIVNALDRAAALRKAGEPDRVTQRDGWTEIDGFYGWRFESDGVTAHLCLYTTCATMASDDAWIAVVQLPDGGERLAAFYWHDLPAMLWVEVVTAQLRDTK